MYNFVLTIQALDTALDSKSGSLAPMGIFTCFDRWVVGIVNRHTRGEQLITIMAHYSKTCWRIPPVWYHGNRFRWVHDAWTGAGLPCYCPFARKWKVVFVDPLSSNLRTEGNFKARFPAGKSIGFNKLYRLTLSFFALLIFWVQCVMPGVVWWVVWAESSIQLQI